MLRKAFRQLRNVEIDWDLQLHMVHVRSLTLAEPEIPLCCCFCRGRRPRSTIGHAVPCIPSHGSLVGHCVCLALTEEEAMLFQGILPLKIGETRLSHLKLVVVLSPTSPEIVAQESSMKIGQLWVDNGQTAFFRFRL